MSEICAFSASELGRLIMTGELSSREVVDAHLMRAESINPTINAITDLQADMARELAIKADNALRLGERAGALHGVPITVKSSIASRGCRHECGTPLRLGQVADEDASLVAKLKQNGAIVLGTTNVPEFLMAYETDNAIYGRTNSPLDPDFTPGGSSGGCSAAVASGCSAGSFGSDAGGSIRIPAHFCGLCGLKPTPGVISRAGHWPAVAGPSTTLATVGPVAKTAEDLDLFLELTMGFDSADLCSLPGLPLARPPDSGLRDLKIGWFDQAWNTPVTPETRVAVQDAARALKERGFAVERIEARGLEQAPATWWRLFGICLKTLIESSVPDGYRLHALSYEAMAKDDEEAETTYRDLLMAWVLQDQLRFKFGQQLRDYPIWLCPVSAVPAFRHGEREWSVDGELVGYPGAFVYSQVFNLLGAPAATIPAGASPDGMPIGVQIVAGPNQDRALTAVARELEAGLRGR